VEVVRNEIRLNLKGLEKIQKEIKDKSSVKVGVLGSKNSRNDIVTNASIGLVHEFGSASKNIPERSFLRVPLTEKMPKEVNKLEKDMIAGLTVSNIRAFLAKLGVKAEAVVQEAFDTGGFGKWQGLSAKTIQKKGFDKVLIETTQLRKSITSEAE
jgi:phage gpG-like protein